MTITLDATDRRLLTLLQTDASLTNQALAERAHISPATCLRRVRRLVETGVIERTVSIVAPDALGAGLTAVLEITLDRQDAASAQAFEAHVGAESAVQQVYRVASGPDFVLIVYVADMPAYHAFAQRCLTSQANVRNVRAFFAVKRSKFAPIILM
jgi:Lrp/AsnC family leucine-responsive transcriptional regulator